MSHRDRHPHPPMDAQLPVRRANAAGSRRRQSRACVAMHAERDCGQPSLSLQVNGVRGANLTGTKQAICINMAEIAA